MSMSSLPRLMRALTCEPLAVERGFLDAFVGVMRRHLLEGASFDGQALHAELGVPMPRQRMDAAQTHGVAVIPVVGMIANRAHSMGAGADQIAATIRAAAADTRVDAIALDMETPGGTVTGTPEAAEAIYAARQTKPVVAVANGDVGSAGYWLGAAAGEFVVSPSSRVGSVGIYMLHEDWTEALAADGVKVTEFSAGKYKTEGAPWKPLDAESEEHMRAMVEEAYGWFVRDVARFRDTTPAAVRDGYGQGRMLPAKDAVAAGMADRVGTLEDTIARLADGASAKRGARASAEVARRKRARARG